MPPSEHLPAEWCHAKPAPRDAKRAPGLNSRTSTYKKTTTNNGNPSNVLVPHLLTLHFLSTLFFLSSSGNLTRSKSSSFPTGNRAFLLRTAIKNLPNTPRFDLNCSTSSSPSSNALKDTVVAFLIGTSKDSLSQSSSSGFPDSAAILSVSARHEPIGVGLAGVDPESKL